MATLLPIRPLPIKGESFPGYILRLAVGNGFKSSKKFMPYLGFSANINIRYEANGLIEKIHQLTQHDELLNASFFLPSNNKDGCFSKQPSYVFTSLVLKHPQVCPTCMVGTSTFHHSSWLFLPITHCAKHRQQLIHKCPKCNKNFDWDISLFEGRCHSCGVKWAHQGYSSHQILPNYLADFFNHVNRTEYVHDLIAAAQRVIRPFDEILDSTTRVPFEIREWSDILDKAYKLLTEPDFIVKWLSDCRVERSDTKTLGARAINAPAITLTKKLKLGKWPILEVDLNQVYMSDVSTLKSIIPTTLNSRKESDSSESAFKYQTNIEGLDRIIGCETHNAVLLVRNHILTRLNRSMSHLNSYYDIRGLCGFCDVMEHVGVTPGLYQVYDFEWLFELFNTKLEFVIVGIFSKNITTFIVPNLEQTLLEQFRVSPFSILLFLQKNLKLQAEERQLITMKTLCTVLAISTDELLKLVQSGTITPTKKNRRYGDYRVSDCYSFLSNYWSLRRWSQITKTCPHEVMMYLNNKNIYGSISENIFTKSKRLKSALRQYVA